ncbi:mitochondrial carrier [Laetiporus sulphureus 93-53]|uniref:Mitochondrial carrier n=1 Tax=Laetiporus sulphureus 93-53 TaxID=1314785 RepID=A0A165GZ77_9APHY|nr:mitochondrial carrier [Laetiporus sulphureus 93-53]KZT11031.1 mitochondrial carrier [Laetiporus sulphureus 93-53]
MGFMDAITLIGLLGLSLAASLLITVPLTGALVRLRANYNPRGLRLDAEGNIEPHTGPVVTSFFGMLRRVKRIEGWAGLYKGLMPTLSFSLVLTIFAVAVLNANTPSTPGRADPPAAGLFGTLAFGMLSMLMSLPAAIITYRSITTPYKLPYFRPFYSLRILLTPTERKRPWILYMTPGLLAAESLHVAYTALLLSGVRALLLPRSGSTDYSLSPVRFGLYMTIEILSTAILCPLEVITTKLAIQRNHAAPEYNSVEQEVEDDALDGAEYTEYSGAEEDVIGLRHEKDPYLGLVDCAKRIIDEEGWRTLYRAWWLTMLSGIASGLASVAPNMS